MKSTAAALREPARSAGRTAAPALTKIGTTASDGINDSSIL